MSTDAELEIVLRHLSVLRLEPGDRLVFRHPGRMSDAAYDRIRDAATKAFGLGRDRILVLEEGMELGVVRGAPDVGVEGE